ncbi:hypothetical protein ACJIZ3_024660 [Penstemon smallii]|uniref:Uncharacterized protein n=1 Tax=Penstemon smallii TaxID=265156 RepID=A0ABD3TSH6_9LAMI
MTKKLYNIMHPFRIVKQLVIFDLEMEKRKLKMKETLAARNLTKMKEENKKVPKEVVNAAEILIQLHMNSFGTSSTKDACEGSEGVGPKNEDISKGKSPEKADK